MSLNVTISAYLMSWCNVFWPLFVARTADTLQVKSHVAQGSHFAIDCYWSILTVSFRAFVHTTRAIMLLVLLKQPWRIWANTPQASTHTDIITITKQYTAESWIYFKRYNAPLSWTTAIIVPFPSDSMNNDIHIKQCDAITLQCHKFNGHLVKPPTWIINHISLKLWM